ncbi:GntR family transcriptional regulator [Humibacter ginsenosidimutans]|uniref:GntR family transcriptional regulator n=1 Tax=Humibacter ginsenosidimutans TaxID=2599293 RepID=A0A5B8M9H8_9MICO|nr:GntR family transcriptional regulator [Humibacter ginsenosidimutans]QDZ16100.1 GntR family transcriptional regulator [Humibacter ginsenosidimutans]
MSGGVDGRLVRVSLAGQIRDYLTLEIAQGRLPPGTPVRELEIAQRLGTSQTPVREAFRELTAAGLLESRTHVGTRVRELAQQDLIDTVPVRAALEGLAGRLAATRIDGKLDEAREAVATMRMLSDGNDRLAFAGASTRFHRAIVIAAGNESLARAWNALGIEIITIIAMASDTYPLSQAADDHQNVLDAVESGDPDTAEHALDSHLRHYVPNDPGETP